MSSLKDIENTTVDFHPRCATCGCQDYFEHNEDYSYIKCTNCGREYFEGLDELLEYNQEGIEEAKEELAKEIGPKLQKELMRRFKKSK